MKSIKNVFFIDDDQLFVFLTKKTIEATDIVARIKEFRDGEEAINYLKKITNKKALLPDIILVDLNMPVMDGWEFLNEYILLKPKIKKKTTVYLVSSSISPHDIERAKNIQIVTNYFIKPLAKESVVNLLKSL